MRINLILLLLFLTVQSAFAETTPLKIGFVLPLSGEWAFLGNGIRDGALLAQRDLQGTSNPVDLIFEDNHGELARSATLGAKLVTSDKVSAMVSIISGVGTILKPLAAKSKVIHVGICSEPEVADGKFNFINYLTAEQGASKYLEYFRSSFGERKAVAIFSLNESGFRRIVKELQSRAGANVHISSIETFDKGTSDFRTILLRTMVKKPDAFLILGLSPEIELLARQARLLSIGLPFTSIEGFGLASDKTPFEGSWFIDSAVPANEFQERFRAAYKREVTPGVGHAYDTVRMLSAAFAGAHLQGEAATKFHSLSNFAGVIGALTVRQNGVIWSDASVKLIKNGRTEIVAR